MRYGISIDLGHFTEKAENVKIARLSKIETKSLAFFPQFGKSATAAQKIRRHFVCNDKNHIYLLCSVVFVWQKGGR